MSLICLSRGQRAGRRQRGLFPGEFQRVFETPERFQEIPGMAAEPSFLSTLLQSRPRAIR